MVIVAMTIPTTSRGQNWHSPQSCHLVKYLFKSFMLTYSPQHTYRFYLGIDPDDTFYQEPTNQAFLRHYVGSCQDAHVQFITLSNVAKNHLTQMWNLLCQRAYEDGCDYFYFCGDDIEFTKQGWIDRSIVLLQSKSNLGLTGPTNNNGNTDIITQTFVHRTHFDIFGYAYPEEIWNWYCDDWINLVYLPEYVHRMDEYRCYNRGGLERYSVIEAKDICHQVVERDRAKLRRFLVFSSGKGVTSV